MRFLFPEADVPVVTVALPRPRSPKVVATIGSALSSLRERGVLLVGSGGAVHNLSRISFGARDAPPEPWAVEFDAWVAGRLRERDFEALLAWRELAPHAALAHPTTEHFDPLFVVEGAAARPDELESIYEGCEFGNLSMRTFALR
ncbi:MAG: DODA-type extradiol aromatic ring-opening family dioxygenase [Thermoanaerobaculia bacterium]